jgi:hypothetical protein
MELGFKKRDKFLRPAVNLQLLLLILVSHVFLDLNNKLSLDMEPSVLELEPNKYATMQNMKIEQFLLFSFFHSSINIITLLLDTVLLTLYSSPHAWKLLLTQS